MHANCCTWDFYFVACSGVLKLNTHLQIVFFKIIQVKRVAFYTSSIPFLLKPSKAFQDIRKYIICKSQYHWYNFSLWNSYRNRELRWYKYLVIRKIQFRYPFYIKIFEYFLRQKTCILQTNEIFDFLKCFIIDRLEKLAKIN